MSWVNNIEDMFANNYDRKLVAAHAEDAATVTVIDPNMDEGPWIGGGAPLNWYNKEPVGDSDIDVFFKNQFQFDVTFGRLMRNNAQMQFSSENAVTLVVTIDNKNRQIQLIRKQWFNSAQDVIDKFDFTICQIVTDGYNVLLGKDTAKDIKQKRIALCQKAKPDVIKRIVKYTTYGYVPDPALVQDILDNEGDYTWRFNQAEDNYHNAF